MEQFKKRVFKILMGIFAVYAILVATHKGEFWPFSIYPMFSQAGHPWTRAMIRDVSTTPKDSIWETADLENIPGKVVKLGDFRVEQVDFSNYISKTKVWDHDRKQALIKMFGKSKIGASTWIIYKVSGHLTNKDSVTVQAVPFLMITADTVLTNPSLPESLYTSQH